MIRSNKNAGSCIVYCSLNLVYPNKISMFLPAIFTFCVKGPFLFEFCCNVCNGLLALPAYKNRIVLSSNAQRHVDKRCWWNPNLKSASSVTQFSAQRKHAQTLTRFFALASSRNLNDGCDINGKCSYS